MLGSFLILEATLLGNNLDLKFKLVKPSTVMEGFWYVFLSYFSSMDFFCYNLNYFSVSLIFFVVIGHSAAGIMTCDSVNDSLFCKIMQRRVLGFTYFDAESEGFLMEVSEAILNCEADLEKFACDWQVTSNSCISS